MAINKDFFANLVFADPQWDYHTFDVSRDTRLADTKVGDRVNMTDPNLRPFMEHGGKLLMYQSWQEAAIPPGGLVDYFEHVQAAMGDPSKTEDSIRLFVVPGAGMCRASFRGTHPGRHCGQRRECRECRAGPAESFLISVGDRLGS